MRVLATDLVMIVAGSFLGAMPNTGDAYDRLINAIALFAFIGGFIATLILKISQFDRRWYGGRAVAESVKTLAWRYAVRAEPFDVREEKEADERLMQSLRGVLRQRELLDLSSNEVNATLPQISGRMRELRATTIEQRADAYLKGRLLNQREWYQKKADYNARMESRYFVAVLILQGLAIAIGIALVAMPSLTARWTGAIAGAAASLLVWTKAKQFQELSIAYSLTSQELAVAAEQQRFVKTEEALSRFVADAESAISREHTMWTARRDHLPQLAKL